MKRSVFWKEKKFSSRMLRVESLEDRHLLSGVGWAGQAEEPAVTITPTEGVVYETQATEDLPVDLADVALTGFDANTPVVFTFTQEGFSVNNDGDLFYTGGLAAAATAYTVTVTATQGDATTASATFDLTVNADPTIDVTVTKGTVLDTETDVEIGTVTVDGFVGNYDFSFRVDDIDSTLFTVDATGKLIYAGGLEAAGDSYTVTVDAYDGSMTVSDEFELFVNQEVAEWTLAGDYDSFKLEATSNSVTLVGIKDDVETDISTASSLTPITTATINGNARVADILTIDASAMANLENIVFNGGNAADTIIIEGTDADETYILNAMSETTTTVVPVYQFYNPYAKVLDLYKFYFGENSYIYRTISRVYTQAFNHLQNIVKTTRTTTNVGTVELEGGAELQFSGMPNVSIQAGNGDDTFEVNALAANYNLCGGNDNDTIDFSDAGRVVIDMGSLAKQHVLSGQAGTIQLNRNIEAIIGSERNDVITASFQGVTITGNGGSDTVTLSGADSTVNLNGARQSVIVRGAGDHNITIANGNHSVVNAAAATGDLVVNLVGDHATILGGAGDDTITLTGAYGRVVADGGDDLINYSGFNGYIYGGNGNDDILISDIPGRPARACNFNYVYGDNGDDIIFAGLSTATNFLFAGNGNDVVVGGNGTDYIYGNTGINILAGLGGRDIIFGGTGRDVLMASQSSNTVGWNITNWWANYANLQQEWVTEGDLQGTIAILGTASVRDNALDVLSRGGGFRNLLYANAADWDVATAIEFAPYNDTRIYT